MAHKKAGSIEMEEIPSQKDLELKAMVGIN